MSGTVKKREPRSPEAPAPDPGGTSFMTDRFLPYLVTQTSNVWNKKFKEDLRRTEVNAKQWSVLANIWRRQEVSPTELAKVTGIDQPTISRMIDQLESRALVRRQVDENNGRYVRLAITPKGRDLLTKVWPIAWKHYQRGIASLSKQEEQILGDLLQRMLNNLRGD
jgi:DNA-binding MarR family transcriptional regulator